MKRLSYLLPIIAFVCLNNDMQGMQRLRDRQGNELSEFESLHPELTLKIVADSEPREKNVLMKVNKYFHDLLKKNKDEIIRLNPYTLGIKDLTKLFFNSIRQNKYDLVQKLINADKQRLLSKQTYNHITDVRNPLGISSLHCIKNLSEKEREKMFDLLVNNGADISRAEPKTPLLHEYVYASDEKLVAKLLQSNTDPNVILENGYSPLHIATMEGHTNIVKLLLDHKANVDQKDQYGETALHQACENGHGAIVELLLDANADIYIQTNGDQVPLVIACDKGYDSIVKLLLNVDGVNINAISTFDKLTALHYACKNGHVAVVELLLNSGADIEAMEPYYGHTPLHYTSKNGHTSVVKLLLNAGANIDAKDSYEGHTPLHHASENGHVTTVELLLNVGADITAVNDYGETALHCASKKGHADVIELLLKVIGIYINAIENNEETALHIASARNHTTVVELLLNAGATIDKKNDEKMTPLEIAEKLGHIDIVNLIKKHIKLRSEQSVNEILQDLSPEDRKFMNDMKDFIEEL